MSKSHKLNALQVKKAKAAEKNGKPTKTKLFDGNGLFLLLHPNGGKYWQHQYTYNGKRKTVSIGKYPDVSLADARLLHGEQRRLLAVDKIDPDVQRKAEKQEALGLHLFEAIAREWHAKQGAKWTEGHSKTTLRLLERDAFPYIGSQDINKIDPPTVLKLIQRIENRGAKVTARKMLKACNQVFRYAIVCGKSDKNPAADIGGALTAAKVTHFPAITEPADVRKLLQDLKNYQAAEPAVWYALQFSPLVFLRPSEIRKAEWPEIDLQAAIWTIPGHRMKMGLDHIVPLSRQALAILRDVAMHTCDSRYVFASRRSKSGMISPNTLNSALQRMGYKDKQVPHGFRAMARTILDEQLGFRIEYIEQQLAHTVKDPLGRAYNRTKHLPERVKMMQAWADYLDTLRGGKQAAANNVIRLKPA